MGICRRRPRLAQKWYGDANLANRDQIVNPNLIFPGQVLRVPQ
jgi:nucleoid-associated protein YgaU